MPCNCSRGSTQIDSDGCFALARAREGAQWVRAKDQLSCAGPGLNTGRWGPATSTAKIFVQMAFGFTRDATLPAPARREEPTREASTSLVVAEGRTVDVLPKKRAASTA